MSFTPAGLLKSVGLQNTKFGQGLIGLQEEEGKVTTQLYVMGALFIALILGITTVILFSTGVSDLESYSDYFNSTGHKVGIGFAVATLIALVVAGFLMDSSMECAETTRSRVIGSPPMPNIIGSVPTYVRPPTPPPSVYQRPVIYQAPPPPQVRYQPRPITVAPRPPPQFPPPNVQVPQYPPVPTSPVYPAIPQANPSLASSLVSQLPGLINVAAPIALAAANAPQGQRGIAAFQAIPQQ